MRSRSGFGRHLLLLAAGHLAWRITAEALVFELRRVAGATRLSPALRAHVVVSVVALPVYIVIVGVWFVRGRGPGRKLLEFSAGAPAMRPWRLDSDGTRTGARRRARADVDERIRP